MNRKTYPCSHLKQQLFYQKNRGFFLGLVRRIADFTELLLEVKLFDLQ